MDRLRRVSEEEGRQGRYRTDRSTQPMTSTGYILEGAGHPLLLTPFPALLLQERSTSALGAHSSPTPPFPFPTYGRGCCGAFEEVG